MSDKRIHVFVWRNHALSFFLALLCVALIAFSIFNKWRLDVARKDLTIRSKLIALTMKPLLQAENITEAQSFAERMAKLGDVEIVIVNASGIELVNSSDPNGSPNKFQNRLEDEVLATALAGANAARVEYDSDRNRKTMFVSIPLEANEWALGVRRDVDSAFTVFSSSFWSFGAVLGISLMIFASMGLIVTKRVNASILELLHYVRAFKAERVAPRKPIVEFDEMERIADELETLFTDLEKRMTDGTRKDVESNVILHSMLEGVVAIDNDERIITINRAARRFLNVTEDHVEGKLVHETIRNADIQDFISSIIHTGKSEERELSIFMRERKFLHLNGTSLKDASGDVGGVLVVLNDFTAIRKLENMRRDFVANVSHEIKTPLTAIKGSVETLLDGAIDSKKDAKRFFKIIIKQSDRLNALIEDILSLSLIEDKTEKKSIQTSAVFINNLLRGVIELFQEKAKSKGVDLRIVEDESVMIEVNQQLLEQAIINLVDNAIKFSERNGVIELGVTEDGDRVRIRVADSGCGIPGTDVERIFERFYMVSKARSKRVGGTGLGLSIVKHVAQIHGGEVLVDSELGKGSEFTIVIPRHQAQSV